MNNILVSVHCLTFNQEKYVAQTIESIINQKTDFNFEILIHDDASTDNTPLIIKKYEMMYPDKIFVIYQSENQYSKGLNVVSDINLARARGKYIAICEGDDYWNDEFKLKKQVAILERDQSLSGCTHSSHMVSDHTMSKQIIRPSKNDRVFTTEEIIEKGGGIFATNSLVFRSDLYRKMPRFFKSAPVGDYPLFIHLSMSGKLFYLDECMSTYRVGTNSSWTNLTQYDKTKIKIIADKTIMMLESLDEYSQQEYMSTIVKRKFIVRLHSTFSLIDFKLLKKNYAAEYNKYTSMQMRIVLLLKILFPSGYFTIKRLRRVINK